MAEDTASKQSETRYSREEAVAAGRALTGHSPHVVAGALSAETAQTFTEAKVKKITDRFVKREEDSEDAEDES